jgi:protein TonB
VYDINQVDVIPAVISPSLPTYPFELRKAGITGSARILLTVRKDGSVTGAMVKDATNQLFGDSALNAAWETKFRPAQLHGEPVDCRFLLPILFNLKN